MINDGQYYKTITQIPTTFFLQMIAKTFHSREKAVELKSNIADLCTETDIAVEKMVFDSIKEKFPSHGCVT